jgi:hypothetical protein
MFACRKHWFQLPKQIRDDIWRGYRFDSKLWNTAAQQAQDFWAKHVAKKAEESRQGSLFT